MGTTTIALAYQGWAFNNNFEDGIYSGSYLLSMSYKLRIIYCLTAFLFMAIGSSAFVLPVRFLLCTISRRFVALSTVVVG
jgi:hypothetical protein